MNFQRARNIQAKAERWDEIVNSTLSLFERTSYANITIKDIAQKHHSLEETFINIFLQRKKFF